MGPAVLPEVSLTLAPGGAPAAALDPPMEPPLRAAMAPAVLRRQLSEPSAAQIAAGVRVRNPLFGP